MAHLIETMAYAGQKPWHGLGVEVPHDISVDDMLTTAKLDWTVEKRTMYTNGGTQLVPGYHSLVRSSDQSVLGICGERFQPTQNKDAFNFFDRFVKSGKMKMNTMGALSDGKWTWALAKVEKSFDLGGVDEVETYMLFSNPHVWGESIKIMFTPIRVVCNNTLTMALNKKTEQRMFRMMHSKAFTGDDLYNEAEQALGLVDKLMDDYQEAATLLSRTDVPNDATLFKYMAGVLTPAAGVNDNTKYEDLPLKVKSVLDLIDSQPGAKLKTSNGTFWGAYNAITFAVDHEMGRSRDTALASAWFGSNALVKRRALNVGIQMARAA